MILIADTLSVFDPVSYLQGSLNVVTSIVDCLQYLLIAFGGVYITGIVWNGLKESFEGLGPGEHPDDSIGPVVEMSDEEIADYEAVERGDMTADEYDEKWNH